ncbi:MAG: amidohydrolase [Pirellulales bacterium]
MNTQKIMPAFRICKWIFGRSAGWAKNLSQTAAAIILACLFASQVSAQSPDPKAWTAANIDALVDFYRQLHQAPELSFQEEKTSATLADELRAVGATVTANVGGHGVVAVLENGPGKVLLVRADMDALPVAEQTGLPYASKVRVKEEDGATVGVMHACGHDIHMTSLVGVARYLAANKGKWAGKAVFICQPAEERGGGAQAMLKDGLFQRFPRPDFAVALHVASEYPTGSVRYLAGYANANVDSVDITIKGRGGHGAQPDTAIDPIVIAAKLVLDLQTIVSREMKPIEPAVVTVGAIRGGTKHNIIPDECRLQLTVRSYSPQVRQKIHDAIRRKTSAAAAGAGAPEPVISLSEGTPSLYNDPELTSRVAATLKRALGDANVVQGEATMGGEDFSQYGLAGVPISMFRVGAVNQARLDEFAGRKLPPPPLHSPLFYPDAKETISTSIPAMAAVVLELLKPASPSSQTP